MYSRFATLPNHSFFLFGPRGTGKTTWLREKLPDAVWFNLLLDKDYLPLLSRPGLMQERIAAAPSDWVVIDEVQRIPALLNEVHDLISVHGKKLKFAISGSSARKLRRMEANLLAGRVLDRKFFPLVYPEFGAEFKLNQRLELGSLPGIVSEKQYSLELLESYVSTYLKEEIQQEALVKNLDSFARFLRVAALLNGSTVDVSNVARECGVGRKSVERYFDTLVDTLIGFKLPSFQPRLKVKERVRPKFYFFDCGVVRALSGNVRREISDQERGFLLETYIMNELRAALAYRDTGGELAYYGAERSEVDIVISFGDKRIGLEIKASERWRPEFGRTLRELRQAKIIRSAYGIYLGEHPLVSGEISVLPVRQFLDKLWRGEFDMA